MLKRVFLGPFRPFEVLVSDAATGESLLLLQRPFRFVFHRLEVRSADGQWFGAIQKRWIWIRRIYAIETPLGQAAELFGPVFRPWTFGRCPKGRSTT